MSLLVFSPDFPPGRGGIQRLAGEFVGALNRDDVRVVALDSGIRGDGSSVAPVLRIPLGSGVDQRLRVLAFNLVALLSALLARPAAIVVTHVVASPAARVWSRLTGRPYVLILHGQEIGHRPGLTVSAVAASHATVAVSRYTREQAIGLGADAGKIEVINPGVDTSGIAASSSARRARETSVGRAGFRVITVARLVDRYKGHDTMVEAIDRLRRRIPDVIWEVVGVGPLRAELEDAVDRRGLHDHVQFHGAVSDAELGRLMAGADVFAMPSRTTPEGGGEGFGLVYLEAAAAGLPVVAGAVAGALDAVIDGRTGLLVDPTDPSAVCDALAGLALDPDRASAMSDAAYEHAASHEWSAFADAVMALFEPMSRRPLRVLALSHTGELGGAERSLLAQLEADRASGSIDPVLAAPAGPLSNRAKDLSIQVEQIGEFDPKFATGASALPRLALAGIAQARAIATVAKRQRVDLIHANSPRAGLVAVAARPLGAPPVVTHVRDCMPVSRRGFVVRRVLSFGSARIVANSRHTAEDFAIDRSIAQPDVVYNPLDARFEGRSAGPEAPSDSNPRLAIVGQITPWKRQDTAIRVLAALADEHPNLRLDVAGSVKFSSGEHDNQAYRRQLAVLTEDLGVSDRVRFVGEVEDVAAVFETAAVVLVPSTEEPFGRVAIEAMATGSAVVATAVGGPREFIEHGANGLLADPDELDEWIEAVRTLIGDRDLRRSIGDQAAADVRRRFARGSDETSMWRVYSATRTTVPGAA